MFALFFFLLDLSCGECNGISTYVLCCSVNGFVCLVCELFGETVRNVFGCGCYLLLNVMEVF